VNSIPRRYVNVAPFFSRRRDHTNFSGYVLISSNMMRWNCSKISILAVTAVLASELHFPILPNFHVDATSFHVLMHLIWIIWWGGNQIVLRSPYLLWAPWSIPWYRLTFVSTSHRFFSHSRKDSVRFLRWYIWCYGRIALRSPYLLSSWSPPATPFPDNVVFTYAKRLVTSYHMLI
jgi:hypothetical protein